MPTPNSPKGPPQPAPAQTTTTIVFRLDIPALTDYVKYLNAQSQYVIDAMTSRLTAANAKSYNALNRLLGAISKKDE